MDFVDVLSVLLQVVERLVTLGTLAHRRFVLEVCFHMCQKCVGSATSVGTEFALHELVVCRVDGNMMLHDVVGVAKGTGEIDVAILAPAGWAWLWHMDLWVPCLQILISEN